jgi:hypothetical protein
MPDPAGRRAGRAALGALAAAGALGLTSCGCEQGIVGDGLAIPFDSSSGAILLPIREGGQVRTALVDLLAPITVLDAPDGQPPSRRCADLTLLAGGVPRAHLLLTATVLHACPTGEPCQVGPVDAARPVEAVIGADAFAPGAVRIDFAARTLALFPDVAGSAAARGRQCEAVIPDPFRGGGTLFIGGTEVDFAARRIALGACLAPAPFDPEDPDGLAGLRTTGVDAELVLSTGLGPTVLGASAYRRYQAASGAPPLEALPAHELWIPAGRLAGRRATIPRLALTGEHTDGRGPCRQVYAHRMLSLASCGDADTAPAGGCPCPGGASFCRAPAVVELAPTAPLEVLVVADDHPVLQALRSELRPRSAEVEGILGTDALARTSIDVDGPNRRVLIRCAAPGCLVRPELLTVGVREVVRRCLSRAAPDVDAGVPDAEPPDAEPPDAEPPDAEPPVAGAMLR